MTHFFLNGESRKYNGDPKLSLLDYLKDVEGITSVKERCSGQGACGACLVEINRKPALSCKTPL